MKTRSPNSPLASHIRKFRRSNGWSQLQVANICGLSVKTIERLERGEPVEPETLRALANGLEGLAFEELLRLSETRSEGDKPTTPEAELHMRLVVSGQQLADLLSARAFRFGHDDLGDGGDTELVADFFQQCQDWGDIWSDLDAGSRVRAVSDLAHQLGRLSGGGRALYGGQRTERLCGVDLRVACLHAVRTDNPDFQRSAEMRRLVDDALAQMAASERTTK